MTCPLHLFLFKLYPSTFKPWLFWHVAILWPLRHWFTYLKIANDIDEKCFFEKNWRLFLIQVLPLNFHTTVILAYGYSVAFKILISIAKKIQMMLTIKRITSFSNLGSAPQLSYDGDPGMWLFGGLWDLDFYSYAGKSWALESCHSQRPSTFMSARHRGAHQNHHRSKL